MAAVITRFMAWLRSGLNRVSISVGPVDRDEGSDPVDLNSGLRLHDLIALDRERVMHQLRGGSSRSYVHRWRDGLD